MFGFVKERVFLKSVEDEMAFLLSFQGETFVRQVYKHYPNARKHVTDKMREGESANKVAAELLRVVLSDQIERFLSPEQKAQLAAYLTTADEQERSSPPFALAKLARSYATMMFRESDLKKLDEHWVKDCLHDVYFAAKGMSPEERSADRLVKAFEEATRSSIPASFMPSQGDG